MTIDEFFKRLRVDEFNKEIFIEYLNHNLKDWSFDEWFDIYKACLKSNKPSSPSSTETVYGCYPYHVSKEDGRIFQGDDITGFTNCRNFRRNVDAEEFAKTVSKKVNLTVLKSITDIVAFFEWDVVASLEKILGRNVTVEDLKKDALDVMYNMIETVDEEYQWRECAHNLRYEYFKDKGFRLQYAPIDYSTVD